MRKNLKSSNGPNRFFSQLAAEKKKSVTALCLVAVMALMWVRVLLRRTPQDAEATSVTEEMDVEYKANTKLRISFIELPEVAGRNDVITRDFFASDGWQDSVDGQVENLAGTEEVNVSQPLSGTPNAKNSVWEGSHFAKDGKVGPEPGSSSYLTGAGLKLEAIGLGENPQAFINDKLLGVGDKLLVDDGVDRYEFEVVKIKRNTVVLRCRQAEITLKLTQAQIIDY
ncbi:MAG: hypothetical protein ACYTBX_04875 [Planctomycetota bacterium]|jgi:hypothetical protein